MPAVMTVAIVSVEPSDSAHIAVCKMLEGRVGSVAVCEGARLVGLFTEDDGGRRPVHGPYEKFHTDPIWHAMIPFHEYFHGDTGAGLGASHQTGWTGLVANLIINRDG